MRARRTGRSTTPVIKACLDDIRLAQSYLAAVASLLRGVARAELVPDLVKGLTDDAIEAQVLARSLDADVMALRDLADPKRGVR